MCSPNRQSLSAKREEELQLLRFWDKYIPNVIIQNLIQTQIVPNYVNFDNLNKTDYLMRRFASGSSSNRLRYRLPPQPDLIISRIQYLDKSDSTSYLEQLEKNQSQTLQQQQQQQQIQDEENRDEGEPNDDYEDYEYE